MFVIKLHSDAQSSSGHIPVRNINAKINLFKIAK